MTKYKDGKIILTMIKSIFAAPIISILLATPVMSACPDVGYLFCDDFTGSQLDKSVWQIGTWKLGRTQLSLTPNILTEGSGASATSFARLRFETYKFAGTEIWSASKSFSLASHPNGYSFKARVRQGPLPSGLVTSFFTYNYDTAKKSADEIDIEILTKNLSNTLSTNPGQFTTWNDWTTTSSYTDPNRYSSQTVQTPLKVSAWHIYEMKWMPSEVDWLIDGALVAISKSAIPNMDTYIRLNFWAPASSWAAAYDANLKVTNVASQNKIYSYDVDWVEVRALP